MGEKRKEYRVGDLTVVWQPDKCIHSEECFHGLPEVFDPGKRPWINVHGAPLERIVAQVERCPSGALSYLRASAQAKQPDLPAAVRVEVRPNGPLLVHGTVRVKLPDGSESERGPATAFCRCGASKNKPYCDGSHNAIGFRDG